jgi:hypothetical protein
MRHNPGGSLKLTYTSFASFGHEFDTQCFLNHEFQTPTFYSREMVEEHLKILYLCLVITAKHHYLLVFNNTHIQLFFIPLSHKCS